MNARSGTSPRIAELEFIRASAQDLDESVPHSSADVVLSRAMLHWLPLDAYPTVFGTVGRVLKPGGWFHSESGGAGDVPRVVKLVDEVAARFGLPSLPASRTREWGSSWSRRRASRSPTKGTYHRPATSVHEGRNPRVRPLPGPLVVLTRDAPEQQREEVIDTALSEIDRLRRADGTYDQTFVRLEILARRPAG